MARRLATGAILSHAFLRGLDKIPGQFEQTALYFLHLFPEHSIRAAASRRARTLFYLTESFHDNHI